MRQILKRHRWDVEGFFHTFSQSWTTRDCTSPKSDEAWKVASNVRNATDDSIWLHVWSPDSSSYTITYHLKTNCQFRSAATIIGKVHLYRIFASEKGFFSTWGWSVWRLNLPKLEYRIDVVQVGIDNTQKVVSWILQARTWKSWVCKMLQSHMDAPTTFSMCMTADIHNQS